MYPFNKPRNPKPVLSYQDALKLLTTCKEIIDNYNLKTNHHNLSDLCVRLEREGKTEEQRRLMQLVGMHPTGTVSMFIRPFFRWLMSQVEY